jgi:penicillin amidase
MPRAFRSAARFLLALSTLGLVPVVAGCSDTQKPAPASAAFGPLGDRADLPVADRFPVTKLKGAVDVVRDKDGRMHIYASSITDAVRVQGYLVARDRHLQLELFRRTAEGRMAEILGSADASTIDTDIAFRHVGLHRVAKDQYAALPADLKAVVDAYADGITQYFRKLRSGDEVLPTGIFAIPVEAFTDWDGADTLAVARLQSYLLSYGGDDEIGATVLYDALRTAFPKNDPDPKVALRTGIERVLGRFAPADPTTIRKGYPSSKTKPQPPAPAPSHADLGPRTDRYRAAIRKVRAWFAPEGFGSNNWSVEASKSATGHALVASDPHLSLDAPMIFWPVAMEVASSDAAQTLKVSGVSFPGIPGIILGHNEHIGWGSTTSEYDVTDVYAETLTPDAAGVTFKGKTVPLQIIDEVINIQGAEPYTYKVAVVPHHGPIQPEITADHKVAALDPKKGALSVRWTGHQVTNEVSAIFKLMRAKDVDEAQQALNDFGVGGQHWNIGDTKGNVLWTSHTIVPIRDKGAIAWDASTYTGTLPCLVLPGDGSAEWTGTLPDLAVPWIKNPDAGFIVTANNDATGDTVDDDPTNDKLPDGTPAYLGCTYDIGFRAGRITTRLVAKGDKISPEDMASIQADARSPMGAGLAPKLIEAIDRAEEERAQPGKHPDLAALVKDPSYDATKVKRVRDLLTAWGQVSDYEAASGIDPDTNQPLPEAGATADEARAAQATLVFDTWLVRVIERVFGDELTRAGRPPIYSEFRAKALLLLALSDPTKIATYDAATGDSALWDDMTTDVVESRHERMMRALLDALDWLGKNVGPDIGAYRWGALHTTRFDALIPLFGQLSIPPGNDTTFPKGFPRHGDNYTVDVAGFSLSRQIDKDPDFTYAHGPVQRFVIDMDPSGPRAWNAFPGGAVWDSSSPFFRDQAELWRKNQNHAVPFLLPDVVAAAASRTVVTAAP